jgi:hypothetical protein
MQTVLQTKTVQNEREAILGVTHIIHIIFFTIPPPLPPPTHPITHSLHTVVPCFVVVVWGPPTHPPTHPHTFEFACWPQTQAVALGLK